MPVSVSGVLAVLVVIVAAVVCGQSALLGNPGPESGMVLAVVGGLAACAATAMRAAGRDRDGFMNDVRAGVVLASLMLLTFLISTAIGQAVAPSCSASAGRLPMLIVSVPVLWLQIAVGAFIGRLVGGKRAAFALVVLVQVGAAVLIARDLLEQPGFRVATHFSVIISGDLLAGASLPEAATGFRMATALFALTVCCIGAALWPAQKARGLVSGAASDSALVWVCAVVCAVTAVFADRAARGALIVDRDDLEERYSLIKSRDHIVVHADPLATTPRDVDALLAEAALWRGRLEARLGPLSTEEIHVYAHATRADMTHYTGASHVDFALPWRRELHVAGLTVPHKTLGHELAHVVAGERADTMLRVPARFVVMHNAAVTEGVAMALTPELTVHDGLTLREQAAAMRATGKAPNLARLFSFTSFFREEPGRAYVAAGALVERIIADAVEPNEAVRALDRLYRGDGELTAITPDVAGLIARHEEALDALPLPKDAVAYAAARFKRPSVLDEVCDPDVVETADNARRRARNGDVDGAMDGVRALEGDDADGTLSSLLTDVRATGDSDGAVRLLRRLVSLSPSPSERAVRELALGIELWRRGDERDAEAVWRAIDTSVVVVDLQRQITATKAFADEALRLADKAPIARSALAFFIAEPRTREGARLAFAEAVGRGSALESPSTLALGRYILGRQLVQQGALTEAAAMLQPLVGGTALPPGFDDQAALALATALVRGGGDAALAKTVLLSAADVATRSAVRLHLRDRADRAERAATAPQAPPVSTATTDPAWADRLLLGAWPEGGF